MKCICCYTTEIVAYVKCFGGSVYPLWFCKNHLQEANQMAEKWNKQVKYIKSFQSNKLDFKIGDHSYKSTLVSCGKDTDTGIKMFRRYASAYW